MAEDFSLNQVELELQRVHDQLKQAQSTPAEQNSFGQLLKDAISEANRLTNEADVALQRQLTSGETTDLHKTMIALEKADVSFKLMMQIRNKIIKAYEEIMRTPM